MNIHLKEGKIEVEAGVFNLEEQKVVYLTNLLRQETGRKDIPENVCEWHKKNWSCSIWLQYLAEMNGEVGILAVQEFPHHNCDDWEDDKQTLPVSRAQATPEEIWTHLEGVAKKIAEKLHPTYKVFLGNETGFLGEHEVCIWFPFPTEKKAIEQSLEQIADVL